MLSLMSGWIILQLCSLSLSLCMLLFSSSVLRSLPSPGDSRHLECQEGRFVSSSEVDNYAGRATQNSQVSTHEPDEVCPIMIGHKGLFKSATPTFLVLGANHPHTKQNNTQTPKKMTSSYKIVMNYDFAQYVCCANTKLKLVMSVLYVQGQNIAQICHNTV